MMERSFVLQLLDGEENRSTGSSWSLVVRSRSLLVSLALLLVSGLNPHVLMGFCVHIDSGGLMERPCSLTGTPESIE